MPEFLYKLSNFVLRIKNTWGVRTFINPKKVRAPNLKKSVLEAQNFLIWRYAPLVLTSFHVLSYFNRSQIFLLVQKTYAKLKRCPKYFTRFIKYSCFRPSVRWRRSWWPPPSTTWGWSCPGARWSPGSPPSARGSPFSPASGRPTQEGGTSTTRRTTNTRQTIQIFI